LSITTKTNLKFYILKALFGGFTSSYFSYSELSPKNCKSRPFISVELRLNPNSRTGIIGLDSRMTLEPFIKLNIHTIWMS
jgi:hypothetical protein